MTDEQNATNHITETSELNEKNIPLLRLKNILESLLFIAGKPLGVADFAKTIQCSEQNIALALSELVKENSEKGIVILEDNGVFQMASSPQNSTYVKNLLNLELREKLTDATIEVLSIIVYRQPISKAEIEAIRGVNSQYSLRQLLIRGLIQRIPNPKDMRSFLYETTAEFLMHMGIRSNSELPDFSTFSQQIKLPLGLKQETETLKTENNVETLAEENSKNATLEPVDTTPADSKELPAAA